MSKTLWVTVGWIKKMTGWDNAELKSARKNNIIKWERTSEGVRYDLNSIPPQFIINNKKAEPATN